MTRYRLTYQLKNIALEFGENDGKYFIQLGHSSTGKILNLSTLPSYLTERKVIIIDSVKSGTGRTPGKDIYLDILDPLFKELSIEHEYHATKSATSISELALSLKDHKVSIIFISGDTSINEFINSLNDSEKGEIAIFPIPGGTGNSLSLSLNITNPLDAIIRLFSAGTTLPLNLYEVDFPQGSHYLIANELGSPVPSHLKFLVVLSWGFHASLVADSDTPGLRKHGIKRFQLAAHQNLNRDQKYEGDFYINDVELNGPFAYWLVTGSQRFEPTFEISPKGDILKDELYVVTFNTQNTQYYIMDIMKEVYDKGSHIKNPNVVYKKLDKNDKIQLKTKNSKPLIQRRFCVDGSIIALPETESHEIYIHVKDNSQHSWKLYIIH